MNQPSTSFSPPKVSEIPRTELPLANMGESAGFAEALRFLRRRGAMIVGCILGTIAFAALMVMVPSAPIHRVGDARLRAQ